MACMCIEQVRNRVSRSDPTVWTDAGSLPEGQCESHGGAAEAGQLTTMCMSPPLSHDWSCADGGNG